MTDTYGSVGFTYGHAGGSYGDWLDAPAPAPGSVSVVSYPRGAMSAAHSLSARFTVTHSRRFTRPKERTSVVPLTVSARGTGRVYAASTCHPAYELASTRRVFTESRISTGHTVTTTRRRSADVLAAVAVGLWQQRSKR